MTQLMARPNERLTRNDLALCPVPTRTDTHQPIGHNVFIDRVEEALSFRHIRITNEEYAVSDDGMNLFAVLRVNAEYEGVDFVIGCRNSNSKKFRIGLVTGYQVRVCTNLSFNGDFFPMSHKHTKNFNLEESVTIGIDKIQRQWNPMKEALDYKRTKELSDTDARVALYDLFTAAKMPISLFRATHKEYFESPSHDEFKPRTLWSLENSVTANIPRLKPIAQYEATARLGKYISKLVSNRTDVIDIPATILN